MSYRKGIVAAESMSVDYGNKIFHCFKQKKNTVDKRVYLKSFFKRMQKLIFSISPSPTSSALFVLVSTLTWRAADL